MTPETLRLSASVFGERALRWWERWRRMGWRAIRRAPKRLRLCESLPLGERRFVAVVEFDAARFLVGGTGSSLVLLSRLPDNGKEMEGAKSEFELRADFEPGADFEKERREEKC
jgi:flagellar biogenesis protein FliO